MKWKLRINLIYTTSTSMVEINYSTILWILGMRMIMILSLRFLGRLVWLTDETHCTSVPPFISNIESNNNSASLSTIYDDVWTTYLVPIQFTDLLLYIYVTMFMNMNHCNLYIKLTIMRNELIVEKSSHFAKNKMNSLFNRLISAS